MRKPWSISTTVRNPERLRGFLQVLSEFEGMNFDENVQIQYQIRLIQYKLYRPMNLPEDIKREFDDPAIKKIDYKKAKKIFDLQNYEDPSMRGRQSVNPLNKLGFAIAKKSLGKIRITELGRKFLDENNDISEILFKSLLKLQYPNPFSSDFKSRDGFDIIPFIVTLKFFYLLEKQTQIDEISKREFCLFIPTLINYKEIENQINQLLDYRRSKNKRDFEVQFVSKFFGSAKNIETKINNLFDYGDNILRFFLLTKYFTAKKSEFGQVASVKLSQDRKKEIEELLNMFEGKAISFSNLDDYIEYMTDITKPELPWEKNKNKLIEMAESIRKDISQQIESSKIAINEYSKMVLGKNLFELSEEELKKHINELRKIKSKINEAKKAHILKYNFAKLDEHIKILRNKEYWKELEPADLEQIIFELLLIIDSAEKIESNAIKDDEGNFINFAPPKKPDIEFFFKEFAGICEVTLNKTQYQWIQEGYPVLDHVAKFMNQYPNYINFVNIFVAPKIHDNTYYNFFIALKYGFKSKKIKILPLNFEQFTMFTKVLQSYFEKFNGLNSNLILTLCNDIFYAMENLDDHSMICSLIDNKLYSLF
ncbi:AlwI family type II restriction endonuclease [Caldicellulosiruptor naganoensis]|uniref:AlwI family type II restriction endonuclease n=1 Tax=Caldicellulosiruptor naganoensis TaxID=29324 RepID=A0ABY7BGG6_9FIRM|nr:AlwI family type II restriction endonuclease [Caldicellulosiruptor naganoensis]WAM31550.1 AlwI family type II restriction endonuclease [Caldicellulosiruptor naganoensis]